MQSIQYKPNLLMQTICKLDQLRKSKADKYRLSLKLQFISISSCIVTSRRRKSRSKWPGKSSYVC